MMGDFLIRPWNRVTHSVHSHATTVGGFDRAKIEVMSLTDRRLKTSCSLRKFCSSGTDIAEDSHLEDAGHDGRLVPG
jgi:hypothetical protein